jgi:hypothetical protein
MINDAMPAVSNAAENVRQKKCQAENLTLNIAGKNIGY